MRLCAAGTQEEGEPEVPPASCESPPLPSGRAARARVSDAFRLPPGCCCDRQGIGCHPRERARDARPYDGLNGASPWGGICPSCCFGQMGGGNLGVTHLARAARPYLRQQMPPIFRQMPMRLLPPKGKGVIRKRGETSCLPSCAPAARSGSFPPVRYGHSRAP